MKSKLLQTEVLIGALLPVVALLIVGETGINQLIHANVQSFIIILILCAFAVFVGEIALVSLIQKALKLQYSEIVHVCQEFAAGNTEIRASVIGDTALTSLAQELNNLLASQLNQQHKQTTLTTETEEQLQCLIREVTSVLKGDLRIKANVPPGNIGTLADVCNALVEELVDLVKWTRHSAQQVMSDAHTLLGHALELAETTETQMLRFSQTTEVVEKMVAFLQRLGNDLQLSVDIAQEIQSNTREQQENDTKEETPSPQWESFVPHLNEQIDRQLQLLNDALHSTQTHVQTAEFTMGDFYTFAQRIHQSSSGILQASEQIGALAKLSEQWNDSVLSFELPEEEDRAFSWQETPSQTSIPTPTSPMKRIQLQSTQMP